MPERLDDGTQQFVEQPQPEQKQEEQQPVKQEESSKDYNFRMLRERTEAVERRNAELERMIQANMSQNQQSTKIELVDDDDDVEDDSYVEGKKYKKHYKGIKKELDATKKQLAEISQRSMQEMSEMRLRSQFSDFDTVVTQENLQKLNAIKPALVRALISTQDLYDRGYTAYEMLKSSGIIDDSYKQQERKIEENRSKPKSAAGSGPQNAETPLARVGDYDRRILTEERKDMLRRQVEEAKRMR